MSLANMVKLFLLSCLLPLVISSPVQSQILSLSTLTSLRSVTVTSTVTTVSTCIGTANASLTVCRRRRGIEEVPSLMTESVNPSTKISSEVTVPAKEDYPIRESRVEPSYELVEASFQGLDETCFLARRPAPRLTLLVTTTATVTATLQVTTFSGSQQLFVISGCYPSTWSTSLCKA